MQILKDSIAKLGVLVPVTVYRRKPATADRLGLTPYVLLDGERRWRCVRELGMLSIPAIIVEEPSEVNNILTMFHIHNLREGWQLMPTALKLETLMEELGSENERELATLSRLSVSQIRRCKILLTYHRKFQDMMLAPQSDRVRADFFIELDRIRGPAVSQQFPPWMDRGDEECIDIMLKKYLTGVISAVTEFRQLAAMYRASEERRQMPQFLSELDSFLSDPKMPIEEMSVAGAEYFKSTLELRRSAKRALTQLSRLNDEALASDEDLIKALQELAQEISRRLQQTLVVEAHDGLSRPDAR